MMLSVLVIFVGFSIIIGCFLSGVVYWDLVERRRIVAEMLETREQMNGVASAANSNSQALSALVDDLADRIQNLELRSTGGLSKPATMRI